MKRNKAKYLDAPQANFGLCPFWFWNDRLEKAEILRQIRSFHECGLGGFVIHNRVGLPRDQGWMSASLLDCMETAIEEASRLGLLVYLYDEGMYPSGSAGGRVVARNPGYAARALALVSEEKCRQRGGWEQLFAEADDAQLVSRVTGSDGKPAVVIDRRTNAFIRGLHYLKEPLPGTAHSDSLEEHPPAANILDPEAVQVFIEESYEKFHARFGKHFGQTVVGIFTDEPSVLGRGHGGVVRPGNRATVDRVSEILGYDFRPYLGLLWQEPSGEAGSRQGDYYYALARCLEESYFRPISDWCHEHGITFTGHPHSPDALEHLKTMTIPGQDLVLRRVEPGHASGLEGPESTQAKAAASAMVHLGLRRNLNEYCGGYGEDFTFAEMQRLTFWLLVRGCNLLMPHAFYYSIRGPRRTERPPDVGMNASWWPDFPPYARLCRLLCELNTDCQPVCDIAILGDRNRLPWRAAKALFEHQLDFHYINECDLEGSHVGADGTLRVGPMSYQVLLVESEQTLRRSGCDGGSFKGTIVADGPEPAWLPQVQDRSAIKPILQTDSLAVRVRRFIRNDSEYLMLFNESFEKTELRLLSETVELGLLWNCEESEDQPVVPEQIGDIDFAPASAAFTLNPFEFRLLRIAARNPRFSAAERLDRDQVHNRDAVH